MTSPINRGPPRPTIRRDAATRRRPIFASSASNRRQKGTDGSRHTARCPCALSRVRRTHSATQLPFRFCLPHQRQSPSSAFDDESNIADRTDQSRLGARIDHFLCLCKSADTMWTLILALLLISRVSDGQVPDSADGWEELVSSNGVKFTARNGESLLLLLLSVGFFLELRTQMCLTPQPMRRASSRSGSGWSEAAPTPTWTTICSRITGAPTFGIPTTEVCKLRCEQLVDVP